MDRIFAIEPSAVGDLADKPQEVRQAMLLHPSTGIDSPSAREMVDEARRVSILMEAADISRLGLLAAQRGGKFTLETRRTIAERRATKT